MSQPFKEKLSGFLNNHLIEALSHNNTYFTKLWVFLGADVNYHDQDGNTLLHFAVLENNYPMVLSLIEHGANLNSVNKQHNTALHLAISDNNYPIALLLIHNGADKSLINQYNYTPLHLAALNNNYDIASLLIERGVDERLFAETVKSVFAKLNTLGIVQDPTTYYNISSAQEPQDAPPSECSGESQEGV